MGRLEKQEIIFKAIKHFKPIMLHPCTSLNVFMAVINYDSIPNTTALFISQSKISLLTIFVLSTVKSPHEYMVYSIHQKKNHFSILNTCHMYTAIVIFFWTKSLC